MSYNLSVEEQWLIFSIVEDMKYLYIIYLYLKNNYGYDTNG
jgi:hypothetical protein